MATQRFVKFTSARVILESVDNPLSILATHSHSSLFTPGQGVMATFNTSSKWRKVDPVRRNELHKVAHPKLGRLAAGTKERDMPPESAPAPKSRPSPPGRRGARARRRTALYTAALLTKDATAKFNNRGTGSDSLLRPRRDAPFPERPLS